MYNKKGLTLVEFLIVAIIIGILAAIAVPMYSRNFNGDPARVSEVKTSLAKLAAAEMAYNEVNRRFTDSWTELSAYGFTRHPEVCYSRIVLGETEGGRTFFLAAANHREGRGIFQVDSITGPGDISIVKISAGPEELISPEDDGLADPPANGGLRAGALADLLSTAPTPAASGG